ncbi:hypothetical protein KPH14_000786 [Odynerus spinipes]|uniref:Uncharacterized protein n=1 Tax=Odynerus spinipes TaxID=1348599 RepID=A0AAD9VL61_9HYME|nr:hypothetical protein KPH14_000786 [Odynerus spinipes]
MTPLLSSLRREKAKIKTSYETGKGRNEIYLSKWFAFYSFKFLLENDRVRNSINTLEASEDFTQQQQTQDSGTQEIANTPNNIFYLHMICVIFP